MKSEARRYVCFRGECAECAANITGTLFKEPPNNIDVIFECRIENIYTAKHTAGKKRQLKGKRRELAAGKMINERKNAITFCREEAQCLKKFDDKNSPILPTTSVLRKAKEEGFLKQHGLIFSNPVLNLLSNAKCGKYSSSIINISLLYVFLYVLEPQTKTFVHG